MRQAGSDERLCVWGPGCVLQGLSSLFNSYTLETIEKEKIMAHHQPSRKFSEPTISQRIAEIKNLISSGDGSPDSQDRINLAVVETLEAIERKLPLGII
jgi:hypothetical protein